MPSKKSILLLVLTLPLLPLTVASAFAAIAHVKDGSTGLTFSAATSATPAFGSNAAVGDQIIVIVAMNSLTATVSSITGLGASDWRPVADFNSLDLSTSQSFNARMQVWVGTVGTAGTTVTVNFPASVTGAVNIQEYSGNSLQLDAVIFKGNSSSTNPNNNEITPASANTLVLANACFLAAPTLSTTPSGFTMLTKQAAGTTLTLSTGYQIQTTRTGVLPQWTLGTSEPAIFIDLAFQATGTTTTPYMRQAWTATTVGSGASTMSTGIFTPLAGDTLIAQTLIDFHGVNVGTVCDGASSGSSCTSSTNTWTREVSAANGTDPDVELWAAFNVAATPISVTTNWTGATSESSQVVTEWVGISSFDVAGATTTGTSATPNDGGVTTTGHNANDVIISAVGLISTASTHETGAVTSGYGSSGNVSPFGENMYGAWSAVSSTGTYTATYTLGSSSAYAGVAGAFKQGTAAAAISGEVIIP
jgi:hypothetical protein